MKHVEILGHHVGDCDPIFMLTIYVMHFAGFDVVKLAQLAVEQQYVS